MLSFFQIDIVSLFIQLLLAVLLGGLVGIERNLAHKTAGLKTFALVSLGSAVFVIISEMIFNQLSAGVNFDPSRIAGQIIVGIGFLAGGMIIFNNNKVENLTTSAGIWVAAGIGMAVGFKFYVLAVLTTILTLIIFILFVTVEKSIEEIKEK